MAAAAHDIGRAEDHILTHLPRGLRCFERQRKFRGLCAERAEMQTFLGGRFVMGEKHIAVGPCGRGQRLDRARHVVPAGPNLVEQLIYFSRLKPDRSAIWPILRAIVPFNTEPVV